MMPQIRTDYFLQSLNGQTDSSNSFCLSILSRILTLSQNHFWPWICQMLCQNISAIVRSERSVLNELPTALSQGGAVIVAFNEIHNVFELSSFTNSQLQVYKHK